MTDLEANKNKNDSSAKVTLNGREISPGFGPPILLTGMGTAMLIAAVAAIPVVVVLSLLCGSIAALVGSIVLSLPAIYVVDKLLKKAGRQGFITGQNVNGLIQFSVNLNFDGFKKIAPNNEWTLVDEPKISVLDKLDEKAKDSNED